MKIRNLLVAATLFLSFNLFAQVDHLLLTEACLTPTDGEFIEIANFTGSAVDLTNYYLSDDMDYALFPGLFGAGPTPDIGTSDFIVKFPDGAMIANGQVITIAFDGAGFFANYGIAADYEIKGTDDTPDMLSEFTVSSSGLTNSGEQTTLFYWDGVSDLVQDVDMVFLGTPSTTNMIANKTDVSVDGPDADTDASTYLADAFTMPMPDSDPGFGFTAKRIVFETGETLTGGNGITGHDETTEDILTSWDTTYTEPNPGIVDGGVPVELSSFAVSVSENSVILDWSTATETNNKGFEVERASEDGQFVNIAFVEGNGTTSEIQKYSFTDYPEATGNYQYRLKQVDFDGAVEYSDVVEVSFGTPESFELGQNYPNPFNPSTTINFALPVASDVKVVVYNMLGQEVAELVNTAMDAGYHTINFDASQLTSGIYVYSISAGEFAQSRKMMLIK
ncbi:MAG: hypothetical protein SCALA702_14130 [Melioribacteraceae bacterium]|nr:MAG: hypothetical protein SCALA702_14130 [Melioribacteraceae bacterium]